MRKGFKFEETRYGFKWGPLDISRAVSDERWGVVLVLKTPRQSFQLRVTPSGLVRFTEDPK